MCYFFITAPIFSTFPKVPNYAENRPIDCIDLWGLQAKTYWGVAMSNPERYSKFVDNQNKSIEAAEKVAKEDTWSVGATGDFLPWNWG